MSEPQAAPPAPSRRAVSRWVVLAGLFAGFSTLLVVHNLHLFEVPIYEDGDFASDSLLVLKAKRFELLHGHHSRFGFYHPGPAILYVLAGAEWFFHDLLHAVPAPHNAHILAHLLLNAALASLAIFVIGQAAGARAGTAAALVFLVYFAREGHLNAHWFAYTFFMLYLPFQTAAASVASGRTRHLGWLALTGGLTVHSHVSLIAFVVPITLYALLRLWAKGGYRLRSLPVEDRRAWALFAGVVGLFVLPLALHFALHYPGEIGRYALYVRKKEHTPGDPHGAGTYLVRTLTHESELGWPLAAAVLLGAAAAALTSRDPERPFARQLGVVALASGAAMTYYALRGVDSYDATYTGIFFGSVFLLCWTLIGIRLAAALDRGPVWRWCLAAAGLGVVAWAATTGKFTNLYPGAPEAPAIADAIAADPRWEAGPPVLTLDSASWVQATALVVHLERQGRRPWVVNPFWDVFTADDCRLNGRPVARLWQIDVAPANEPRDGVSRVWGEFGGATVREVNTRVPFGAPIPIGHFGRTPGAKPDAGWEMIADAELLVATRPQGELLVDLDRCPTREVRLTVTAQAMVICRTFAGQRVGVAVNGQPAGELRFAHGLPEEHGLTLPAEVLNSRSPARITFSFPDAWKEPGWRVARSRPYHSIWLKGLMLTPVQP